MALTKLDFEAATERSDHSAVLKQLLALSRERDTLTLWHLLYRTENNDRILVYERLAELAPPPPGVTRDGVLQLDETQLRLWKGHLDNIWTGSSPLKKGWINLWTRTLGKVKGLEEKK
jgi:hypothetical protein